jgi:tetratricopeptide (TPR) repeat protein
MRLSIFATPPHLSAASAPPGALEGRLLRSRLGNEDTALELLQTDPGQDLAEQLDKMLTERAPGLRDAVLLYAACPVLLSVESELFLCLDPAQPLVGDALADVAAVLRERAPGPTLLVLDLLDVKANERKRGEAIVRAVERAVDAAGKAIEVLLSVRAPGGESRPSPFSEALVMELDVADKAQGLTARALFERVQARLRELVPVFHHVQAAQSFAFIPLPEGKIDERAALREPVVNDLGVAAFRAGGNDLPPPGSAPSYDLRLPGPPPAPRLAAPTMPSLQMPENVDLSWDDESPSSADMVAIAAPRPLAAPPGASLPPPPGASLPPPPADGPVSSPISGREISPFARYVVEGEVLAVEGDHAGAIAAYRKALSVLGPAGDPEARAEMYTRIGDLRVVKGDRDDAAADFEKALALRPGHVPALSSLIEVYAATKDWRGLISAEERLLSALHESDDARFERLMKYGARWEDVADKPQRAKQLYGRASDIRPDDPAVHARLVQVALKLSAARTRGL